MKHIMAILLLGGFLSASCVATADVVNNKPEFVKSAKQITDYVRSGFEIRAVGPGGIILQKKAQVVFCDIGNHRIYDSEGHFKVTNEAISSRDCFESNPEY
jgi:hypothetical protein